MDGLVLSPAARFACLLLSSRASPDVGGVLLPPFRSIVFLLDVMLFLSCRRPVGARGGMGI